MARIHVIGSGTNGGGNNPLFTTAIEIVIPVIPCGTGTRIRVPGIIRSMSAQNLVRFFESPSELIRNPGFILSNDLDSTSISGD